MAFLYGTLKRLALCNTSGLPQGEGGGNPESQLLLNNTTKSGRDRFARHDTSGNASSLIAVKEIGSLGARKPLARLLVSRPKASHLRCVSPGKEEGVALAFNSAL